MELRITTLLASGDRREALALIAQAFADDIGRYCTAMTTSEAEAEELVQEILIEAYLALDRFEGVSSVRAFLFGIARRRCIRHLKKRDRRRALRALWLRPPEATMPADPVERSEDARALRRALAELRPLQREAVLLRYQAGLDSVELALALGVSNATARKRVSLGVKALREHLRQTLMQPGELPTRHPMTGGAHDALPGSISTRLSRS
ncbi:MAG: RNA polymerase sigma-70 factor (ECF subfamily) [Myxococcota bacterium]|jgi:RNA polymerase sigma-70 factor (ECF subfamily)